MPDDNTPQVSSPPGPRPKPPRSNTIAGTVRPRASPTPDQTTEARPPTKRARKAINCEPCRNSKLKNRPCSSCVLRGTAALCYQDAPGHEGPNVRGDDHHYGRIDPAQEIARLRHSITLLEAHIFPNHRSLGAAHPRRASDAAALIPKKEAIDTDVPDKDTTDPSILGTQSGHFAGPTSAATYFASKQEGRGSEDSDSRHQSQDRSEEATAAPEYDRDLLAALPGLEIIDGLVNHYFEYCNWIYRHVNEPAFRHNWERFKSGQSADRLVLATVCAIMALAVHYLPAHHTILESLSESHDVLGLRFYDISGQALQRRMADSRKYTLELVELLLIRSNYQTLHKTDTEEIWHIVGELMAIGKAMGLHRDPGKWRMHRDVAERRRWAWWHIILLERLVAASHNDHSDPESPRLYLPNIALFRLAFILGDIIDDALSVRPVSHDSVLASDRQLTQWMEDLPQELDLDEFRVARNLASSTPALRRLGVQSVIIRTSYHHIRFTLHRPYASSSPITSPANKAKGLDPAKTAQSLEIAVSSADKLITMVGQSRPDFLANSALAVPGHMNWGPFHCFSAAMFFSFQLIANPDQPGAGLFRQNIRKALATLEQCRGIPVADRAYDILTALAPLHAAEFPLEPHDVREKRQAHVLSVVRKLALPYHDARDSRHGGSSRTSESPMGPGGRNLHSPANSSSLSPPLGFVAGVLPPSGQPYDGGHSVSSVRTTPGGTTGAQLPPIYIHNGAQHHQNHMSASAQSPQVMSPTSGAQQPNMASNGYNQFYSSVPSQQLYSDPRYPPYAAPVEEAIWGASVGFGQGEWAQFLDGIRPDTRHLPVT
ncbi:hypothetical protein HGRIS_009845 [Hohenbuehelia grisea]|uniref:Xylanolytic transcriptional activator regulatory domain-containing protein n=1 Tax=Hohenbuehelia grisea TaxID=104357 RepID=A0ABR3J3U7_9AGAR